MPRKFKIELEREADGPWIAEVPDLPGVLVYGATRSRAIRKVRQLARRVLIDNKQSSFIRVHLR